MRKFDPKRLKAERVAAGLTQEQLASKLGKERDWIAKRENSIVNTGTDDLAMICQVLGTEDFNIFFT